MPFEAHSLHFWVCSYPQSSHGWLPRGHPAKGSPPFLLPSLLPQLGRRDCQSAWGWRLLRQSLVLVSSHAALVSSQVAPAGDETPWADDGLGGSRPPWIPAEDRSKAQKVQRPPLPPRSPWQSGLLVCARRWGDGGCEAPTALCRSRGNLIGAAPATSRFPSCGPRAHVSSVPAGGVTSPQIRRPKSGSRIWGFTAETQDK